MSRRTLERRKVVSELTEALGEAVRRGHPTGTLVTLSHLLSEASLLGPEAFGILLWGIVRSPALRDTLRKAPPPEAADVARFLDFVPEIAFVLGKSREGKAVLGKARRIHAGPEPAAPRATPLEYQVLADLLQLGNVFLGHRRRIEYLESRLARLEGTADEKSEPPTEPGGRR